MNEMIKLSHLPVDIVWIYCSFAVMRQADRQVHHSCFFSSALYSVDASQMHFFFWHVNWKLGQLLFVLLDFWGNLDEMGWDRVGFNFIDFGTFTKYSFNSLFLDWQMFLKNWLRLPFTPWNYVIWTACRSCGRLWLTLRKLERI